MDETLKQILNEAKKVGYKYLAFSCYDEANKTSEIWKPKSRYPYACYRTNKDMVFAYPEINKIGLNNWMSPPIWDIIHRAGIHGGCGNNNQCQIDISYSKSIGAIRFHLIDGEWKEIPWRYSWKLFKRVFSQVDNMYDDLDFILLAENKLVSDVFTCPLEELPLYVNENNSVKKAIVQLRLENGIQ